MTQTNDIRAWLVTGSATFPDMACATEREADNCLFVRNDGCSYKMPLIIADTGNQLYRALFNSHALMTVILRVQHDGPAFNILTKRLAKQVEANSALFQSLRPVASLPVVSQHIEIQAFTQQLHAIRDRKAADASDTTPPSVTIDYQPLIEMLHCIRQSKKNALKNSH